MANGPDKPQASGITGISSAYVSEESLRSDKATNNEGVRLSDPIQSIPKGTPRTPATALRNRQTTVQHPQISPVSDEIQNQLNEFCLTGSAYSFLSLLNSQEGLDGKFNIVYQPKGNKDPIPLNEFNKEGNETIQVAYEEATQQIANNSQSIAYDLMNKMVMQQQWMAEVVIEQQRQQVELNSQMSAMHMALLQTMMNPVIRPEPVPFSYLSGFSGSLPQLPAVLGNMPTQSAWAQYPQPMMAIQPGLQLPPPYPVLQPGFSAVPTYPALPEMGLQLPFSPLGQHLQSAAGFGAQLGLLPPFYQGSPQSFVPPWTYAPFSAQTTPLTIRHNLAGRGAHQGGRAAPIVNATIAPVIRNTILTGGGGNGYTALNDETQNLLKKIKGLRAKRNNSSDDKQTQALADRLRRLEQEFAALSKQQPHRSKSKYNDIGADEHLSGSLQDKVIPQGKAEPNIKKSHKAETSPLSAPPTRQDKDLLAEIKGLRDELKKINSPDQLADLLNRLQDALSKNVKLKQYKRDAKSVIADLQNVIDFFKEKADKAEGLNDRLASDLEKLRDELEDKDDQIQKQAQVISKQNGNIKKLQDRVDNLNDKINDFEDKNEELEQNKNKIENKLKQEVKTLCDDLDANRVNQRQLQKQLNEKERELAELRDGYGAMKVLYENKIAQLKREKDNVINELRDQVESVKLDGEQKIGGLENNVIDLNNQLLKEQKRVTELEQAIEDLESSLGNNDQEIEQLRNGLQAANRELSKATDGFAKAQNELTEAIELNNALEEKATQFKVDLEKQRQEYEKEAQDLKDNIKHLVGLIEAQNIKIRDLEETDGDNKKVLDAMESELKGLWNKLNEEQEKYKELQDDMNRKLIFQENLTKEREEELEQKLNELTKQRDDLSVEIERLNEKIQSLRDSGDDREKQLTKQLEALNQERNLIQQNLDSLKKNLSDLKNENQLLKGDISNLKSQIASDQQNHKEMLKKAKEEAERKSSKLEEKIDKLIKKLEEKNKEIEEKETIIDSLTGSEADKEKLKDDLAKLKSERDNGLKEIENLKDELIEVNDKVQDLEKDLTELHDQTIKEQAEYKAELEKQKTEAQDVIQGLTEQINQLETNQQEKERKIAAQAEQIQRLEDGGNEDNAKLAELKGDLKALEIERDNGAKTIKDLNSELAVAKEQIEKLEEYQTELRKQINKEQAEHEAALNREQDAIKELEAQDAKSQAVIANKQEELDGVHDMLVKANTESAGQITDLGNKIVELEVNKQNQERQLENKETEIKKLIEENEERDDNIAQLQENLKNLNKDHEEANQKLDKLKEELTALKQTQKEANTESAGNITLLENTITELENKVTGLEADKTQKEKEIEDLKTQRDIGLKEIENLKDELIEVNDKVQDLEKDLTELHDQTIKEQAEYKAELEKQKTEAQDVIQGLTEQINQLETNQQEKERKIAAQAEQIQRLEDGGNEDNAKLAELKGDLKALEIERDNGAKTIKDLNSELAVAKEQIEKLEEYQTELRKQINKEQAEHEAALNREQDAIKELEAQDAKSQAVIANKQEELDGVHDMLAKANTESAGQITDLGNKIVELEVNKQNQERQLENKETEIKKLIEENEERDDNIAQLQENLKNLNKDHEEANQKLDKLKEELTALKQTQKEANTESAGNITLLENTITELENKVTGLEADKTQKEKEIEDLKTQRDIGLKEIENLKDELIEVNDKVQDLEKDLTELHGQTIKEQAEYKAELEKQKTEAQETTENLTEQIQELKTDREEKEREIAAKNAQITSLTSGGDADKEMLAQLRGELAGLEAERDSGLEEISNLKEELAEVKGKVQRLEKDLTELRDQIEKERAEYKAELASKQTAIEELEAKEAESQADIANKQEDLNKLNKAHTEAIGKLEDLRLKLESDKTVNEQLTDRLTALQEQLKNENELSTNNTNALKDEIEKLEAKKQDQDKEINIKEEVIQKLQARVEKSQIDIDNKQKELESANENIKTLSENLDALTKNLEETTSKAKGDTKNLESKISSLEEEIEHKNNAIETKKQEISNLNIQGNEDQKKLGKLNEELNDLIQQKTKKEAEVVRLKLDLEAAREEIELLKNDLVQLSKDQQENENKLHKDIEEIQKAAQDEKNQSAVRIKELEDKIKKLKNEDSKNTTVIAQTEKVLKETRRKHENDQKAYRQHIQALEKERNNAKMAAAISNDPKAFVQNIMNGLSGQDFDLNTLPTQESTARLLGNINVKELDVAQLAPELKARWLILIRSAQALDRLNILSSDREKNLKEIKAESLPGSLAKNEKVLNGVEQLSQVKTVDDEYIGLLKEIKKNLADTINKLHIDDLDQTVKISLKKAYLDQALNHFDSVIDVVSADCAKNKDAIEFVEKAIEHQNSDGVEVTIDNVKGGLSDYLNDELMQNKVRSELESADRLDTEGIHSNEYQRKVSSHKALRLLKRTLISILEEEEKVLNLKAKEFKDIEASRKIAANVRSGIENLRLSTNREIAERMSEEFQRHWEKYIDVALEKHQTHIKGIEYPNGTNKVERLDRLSSGLLKKSNFKSSPLTTLKEKLSDSPRGFSGIERAISVLRNNDDLLADVIWAVGRATHMQKDNEHHDSVLYGNRVSEADQQLALQKMLTDAYVRHGVTDQITPAEMITALADQATRIDSNVIEIASERYSTDAGKTKGQLLRNEKILDRCLNLLALEVKDNGAGFWRGVPTDSSGKPKTLTDAYHAGELEAFAKRDYISLPDGWENRNVVNGAKEGDWQSGGTGLLDNFYAGQGDIKIKEHVGAGERFISKKGSTIVFTQRKQPDGQYAKMTVDINGTTRKLDPKLFLAYPNYQSPFHKGRHRSSIPLTSTVTSEVGELVYSGDRTFPEHYYRIVNQGPHPNSTPVLQCVPIGENNRSEEEFHGSVVAWLACGDQPDQAACAKALGHQAWKAYQDYITSQGKTPDSESFKSAVLEQANTQRQQGKDWVDSTKYATFETNLGKTVEGITGIVRDDAGMLNAVSSESLENTAVILPSALKEMETRRKQRGKRSLSQAHFAKASLPADFEYHVDEHTRYLSALLGTDHPCESEIKRLREREKEAFVNGVFYPLHVFDGTEISLELDGKEARGRDVKARPLTLQIKAMKQQLQLKTEESMAYVEDCAVLEQKVLALMPTSMQPCSIEDAKRIFGQVDMSEAFAKTMMAYLAAESAKDISRGLISDIKALAGAMVELDRNRLRMESNDYIKACRDINFKNARVARKYMAMHQRLIDRLGAERLDPQGIAAKKFENTKGSILRDYQLGPAHKMLTKVREMAEASKSSNAKRDKKNRIVCQLGTGFGKTELTKMLMNQACLEGIGAGYIGPQSNVKNYNVDLSRHMKTAGGKCQYVDLGKMKSERGSQWWKNEDCLTEINNIICGLPKNGSAEASEAKIPWTMSTADLGALLALHDHLAEKGVASKHYQLIREIVTKLSGASRSNRPLIMRDEFDTFNDSEAIAKHCSNILGQAIIVTAENNRNLRLSYDFSIHNAIYLSASKDSDYISLLRADEVSLDNLAESSNKDVNTCELRAEQYLLKARWCMQTNDHLRDTIKTAIQQFGINRDLVFCDPTYGNNGGSQRMAWDGIEAMDDPDVSQGREVKGHLYFKDGQYYCYSQNSTRYGKKAKSSNQITLGMPLTEADHAEIMKTGGAGYITWMSEKRGYTAAQKNEEPDTTAFVFRNLSQLSPSDRQQMLGRDRNIEEYSDHDNMVIVTSREVTEDWVPVDLSGKKIKETAEKRLKDYENKKEDLLNNISDVATKNLVEIAVNTDIAYVADKGKDGKVSDEQLKAGFDKALDRQAVIWKNMRYPADKMTECARARWSAVHYIKNQVFTIRAAEFDVSKDKATLESQADNASKHAAINDLRQQEQDFVATDLAAKVDSLRGALQEQVLNELNLVSEKTTKDDQQIATNIVNAVCKDVKSALSHHEVKKVKLKEVSDNNTVKDKFSNNSSHKEVANILVKQGDKIKQKDYSLESSNKEIATDFNKAKQSLIDRAKQEYLNKITDLQDIIEEVNNDEGYKKKSTGSGVKELDEILNKMKEKRKSLSEHSDTKLRRVEHTFDADIASILNAITKITFYPNNGVECTNIKNIFEKLASILYTGEATFTYSHGSERSIVVDMKHKAAVTTSFYFEFKKSTEDNTGYKIESWGYRDDNLNKRYSSKEKKEYRTHNITTTGELIKVSSNYNKTYKKKTKVDNTDESIKSSIGKQIATIWSKDMEKDYSEKYKNLEKSAEAIDIKRKDQQLAKLKKSK